MRRVIIIILSCLINCYTLFSQEAGLYVPLSLKNATPIWDHLSMDSTIIGYQDSISPNASYDGTSHLDYFHQSLPPTIEDGYLYISMSSTIGGATGGGIIEKINLETGASVWKDVFDIRTMSEREMPVLTKIEGDTLLVFGYQSLPGATVVSHSFYGKLFIKKYDKHTGTLIEEFYADETHPDNHNFSSNHFFEYDNRKKVLRYYNQYGGFIGKEGLMVRKTINLSGQIEAIDTLRGAISHFPGSFEYPVTRRSTFQTHNDQLFFVETYAPIDTGLVQSENHAAISKYDESGNLIYSKEIPKTVLDSFEWLFINHVTDEFIVLEGYYGSSRDEQFTLILDHDANVVKKIKSFYEGRLLNLRVCPAQNSTQETLFFQHRYDFSSKQAASEIYKADETGQLELLKIIERDDESYTIGIPWGLYLENGDVLIYLFHSYWVDPSSFPSGSFKNWLRFAPEELGLPPAINPTVEVAQEAFFKMYPNPATEEVVISTEKPLNEVLKLQVFDVLGALVLEQKIDSNETTLNISGLEAGTYFASLINPKSGSVNVSKLIKIE